MKMIGKVDSIVIIEIIWHKLVITIYNILYDLLHHTTRTQLNKGCNFDAMA